eukprot:TRINITY_DN6116_c0_g1_i2.p1 TRINITY_DN6116_c0_g1~~TRINITY_DN6116_c0_g1_i2.p1  ORF type:complete len:267 (-),score=26.21 TRINITY_DN6116_c0_g1_i2:28-828(-)
MRAIILLSFVLVIVQGYAGIGDSLYRTFTVYKQLPITTKDAQKNGWTATSTQCDLNVGIAWNMDPSGPTEEYPVTLFFTGGGQISGFMVSHFYAAPLAGLSDYWVPNGSRYDLTIAFREPTQKLCSSTLFKEPLGTVVTINPATIHFAIPINESEAGPAQFTRGACIGNMGRHWALDLATAPKMSWIAKNLMPVVPMYHNGTISAVFVETPILQDYEPFGEWEIPLYFGLMCKNFCDSSCGWDVSKFNTFHFFFHDPTLNTCSSSC